jgi:monooxygenase
MLEKRHDLGGTWDLFRYPGIRSDSDMFTLGFGFKPWVGDKSIADGHAILDYLNETVDEYGLRPHIRLNHRVLQASWSSETSTWTVQVESPTGCGEITCSFMYMASGYYDNEKGYRPRFPGEDNFKGLIVHPQEWPEDLDYAGKKVAVIGSGATAITLVPAIAKTAAKVTMVQRSPSYVAIDADVDQEAIRLRSQIGAKAAFEQVRLRNMEQQQASYKFARDRPDEFKQPLFDAIDAIVGSRLREKHFTPSYRPWDQRLCLVPNGDLFEAIKDGRAEVATGIIDEFTEHGILMESGHEVQADIIVTATGLNLCTLGNVAFSVDGRAVNFAETYTYKGVAFSGVPNLVQAHGYLNSSWTLRLEQVNQFWSSLLTTMDKLGAKSVTPTLRAGEENMPHAPWMIGVTSGYFLRYLDHMPKQGDRLPWLNPQVHEPTREMLLSDPDDGVLQFA